MTCISDSFLYSAIFGYVMGCFVWGFFMAWVWRKK